MYHNTKQFSKCVPLVLPRRMPALQQSIIQLGSCAGLLRLGWYVCSPYRGPVRT